MAANRCCAHGVCRYDDTALLDLAARALKQPAPRRPDVEAAGRAVFAWRATVRALAAEPVDALPGRH